jgi:NADH:ubiquinone oxidoreductase subunit H
MISYEVSFGVIVVNIILLARSFNLSDIVLQQKGI